MPDDLEQTIRRSLDQHAATVRASATGELDDVYVRVDRRRSRRRAVAVTGSLAAVAAGVIGIAAVGTLGGGSPANSDGDPALGAGPWACTGQIGGDGVYTYYSNCQPVPEAPNTAATCVTVPATTTAYSVEDSLPTTTTLSAEPPPSYITIAPDSWCSFPECGLLYPQPSFPPTTMPSTTDSVPQTWVVQKGETWKTLAASFGIDPETLAQYNGWASSNDVTLNPGDPVLIPPMYDVATTTTLWPSVPVQCATAPTTTNVVYDTTPATTGVDPVTDTAPPATDPAVTETTAAAPPETTAPPPTTP